MTLYNPLGGDYTISSGFGGRASPGGIGSTNHMGIDLAAPLGTPVIAPDDIRITTAGAARGFGNLIEGVDKSGQTYQFGHLSQIGVKVGDVISGGSIIGAVGSTGNSTGNHLHFGLKDAAGNYLNPSQVLAKGKQAVSTAVALAKSKAVRAGLFVATGGASEAGYAVADAFGIGQEECGKLDFVCKLKEWFKKGAFFTRLAMFLIALIFLWAAFTLLARGQVTKTIAQAVK